MSVKDEVAKRLPVAWFRRRRPSELEVGVFCSCPFRTPGSVLRIAVTPGDVRVGENAFKCSGPVPTPSYN
jgi:hypothetical protein